MTYFTINLFLGKCTDRLNTINASHRTALKSNFDLKDNGDNNNKTCSVFNNITRKTYIIAERTSERCALMCQSCICYHSYSCTCIDYFIKSNICKHIHFYCIHNDNIESRQTFNLEITEINNMCTRTQQSAISYQPNKRHKSFT